MMMNCGTVVDSTGILEDEEVHCILRSPGVHRGLSVSSFLVNLVFPVEVKFLVVSVTINQFHTLCFVWYILFCVFFFFFSCIVYS